jgi:hypothetical protein
VLLATVAAPPTASAGIGCAPAPPCSARCWQGWLLPALPAACPHLCTVGRHRVHHGAKQLQLHWRRLDAELCTPRPAVVHGFVGQQCSRRDSTACQASAGVEHNGEVFEFEELGHGIENEAEPCRFRCLLCCLLRARPAEEHQLVFHQIDCQPPPATPYHGLLRQDCCSAAAAAPLLGCCRAAAVASATSTDASKLSM